MKSHSLKPFSNPPSPFSIIVETLLERDHLKFDFTLTGDITTLNLPSPAENPKRTEGLYHHTCFEIFLKRGIHYFEWNFSFTGNWCVFEFEDYRVPAQTKNNLGSHLFSLSHLSHGATAASMKVSIPINEISLIGKEKLQLGISAVLEHPKGILSYWALNHPHTQPDFHHPKSFIELL